jgi:hypothetical protein
MLAISAGAARGSIFGGRLADEGVDAASSRSGPVTRVERWDLQAHVIDASIRVDVDRR